MPNDVEDAVKAAIYDVVLNAYVESSDGLAPAYPSGVLLSSVWPPQPIDEQQYGNAWSPLNPTGWAAATENLSKLADRIPTSSNIYTWSLRGVEDEYGQMLDFARANRAPQGPAALAFAARSRMTVAADTNETTASDELPASVAAELADRVQKKVRGPDGKEVDAVVLTETAQQRKELAVKYANEAAHLAAVRSLQQKVSPADAGVLESEARSALARATTVFTQFRSLMPPPGLDTSDAADAVGATGDRADAIDKAFYQAGKTFTASQLASTANPGIFYHPSYFSPENWTSPDAATTWPTIHTDVAVDGGKVRLSLAFSRVDITRPWLLMSLFGLPDWQVLKGPGSISDGKTLGNAGSLGLMPQSIIVSRNVLATAANGDAVYRAAGLQILAWLSNAVPFSPPT